MKWEKLWCRKYKILIPKHYAQNRLKNKIFYQNKRIINWINLRKKKKSDWQALKVRLLWMSVVVFFFFLSNNNQLNRYCLLGGQICWKKNVEMEIVIWTWYISMGYMLDGFCCISGYPRKNAMYIIWIHLCQKKKLNHFLTIC
jgi:hypothetical protein